MSWAEVLEEPAGAAEDVLDSSDARVHPWRRYWARFLDLALANFVAGIALAIATPELLESNSLGLSMGVLLAWVPLEAWMLATWGRTPGKALLNMCVVGADHGDARRERWPGRPAALERSAKVWVRGLALGIPVANLVAVLIAHDRLTKNGLTTWDEEAGTRVVHGDVSATRWAGVALAGLGALALMALGTMG